MFFSFYSPLIWGAPAGVFEKNHSIFGFFAKKVVFLHFFHFLFVYTVFFEYIQRVSERQLKKVAFFGVFQKTLKSVFFWPLQPPDLAGSRGCGVRFSVTFESDPLQPPDLAGSSGCHF